jgi:phosphinothricin acetyltransferase
VSVAATLHVRPSRDADVAAIARIYGHWVQHGTGSFELDPPGEEVMARRRRAIVDGGFPYRVATDVQDGMEGAVLGYAYAGPYRPRPAYRFTVEDSIYVAPEAQRRGVAAALLQRLLVDCEALGHRLVVAVIGDSSNVASIQVHERFGFKHAGLLPACGWKHGRWLDSVFMTRALGPGAATPPERP